MRCTLVFNGICFLAIGVGAGLAVLLVEIKLLVWLVAVAWSGKYVILNVLSYWGWIVISVKLDSSLSSCCIISYGDSESGGPWASHLNRLISLIEWTPCRSMCSILILFGAGMPGLTSWKRLKANWWTSSFQFYAFSIVKSSILSAKFSNLTSI